MRTLTPLIIAGVVVLAGAQSLDRPFSEWTDYGGDLTGAKYSVVNDITRENEIGRASCRERV